MNDFKLLTQDIDDKTIVWFESSNEYLVTEKKSAQILQNFHLGLEDDKIAEDLASMLDISIDKSSNFISRFKNDVYLAKSRVKPREIQNLERNGKPNQWNFITHYKINSMYIQVRFQNNTLASLIHPKYAHLEINPCTEISSVFEVYHDNNQLYFEVDGQFIGSWTQENVHYFQGKFSMELIQQIHQKPESEWIGVFHASAVSNTKKSALFLGDSGNGKSTSLALLQANGFTCLADDFVPMAAQNCEVYRLPSAISVKKNSWPILEPFYPQLADASEYHLKAANKIVRYLPPNSTRTIQHLPCKDLVFIKYQEDSGIQFSEMPKIEAFERLIPDSWISPIATNVQQFLDWFSSVNCYQLTYSHNEKMIQQAHELFSNDL